MDSEGACFGGALGRWPGMPVEEQNSILGVLSIPGVREAWSLACMAFLAWLAGLLETRPSKTST